MTAREFEMADVCLSVVVPTYQPEFLGYTLEALSGQTLRLFEVLVVENGPCVANVAALVAEYRSCLDIRHIHDERAGLNRARNIGVGESRADLIALLDDDCEPVPGWAEAVVQTHRDYPAVGVVGGRVSLKPSREMPAWFVGEFQQKLSRLDLGNRRMVMDGNGYIVGANMSFARRIFQAVGGFREDFGLVGRAPPQLVHDELLFNLAAADVGTPGMVYSPEMHVEHLIPGRRLTLDYLQERFYGDGISSARLASLRPGEDGRREVLDLLVSDVDGLPGIFDYIFDQTRTLDERNKEIFTCYFLQCRLMSIAGKMDAYLDHISSRTRAPNHSLREARAHLRGAGGRPEPLQGAADGGHRSFPKSVLKSRGSVRRGTPDATIDVIRLRLAYWRGLWQWTEERHSPVPAKTISPAQRERRNSSAGALRH